MKRPILALCLLLFTLISSAQYEHPSGSRPDGERNSRQGADSLASQQRGEGRNGNGNQQHANENGRPGSENRPNGQRGARPGNSGLPREFVATLNLERFQGKELSMAYTSYSKELDSLKVNPDGQQSMNRAELYQRVKACKTKHVQLVRELLPDSAFTNYLAYLEMDQETRTAYNTELKLKLSPEQAKQYQAIQQAVKEINTELTLKYSGNRTILFAAMQGVSSKQKQMLASILSPEQMAIYTEANPERRRGH